MKKLKYILITYVVISPFCCYSQQVKSADGVSFGERSDFIYYCAEAADKKLISIKGLEVETKKYCACICDNLIPTLYSWELEIAINENKMLDLLSKDENFEILKKCLDGNYKIINDNNDNINNNTILNNKFLNFEGLTFSYPENWKVEKEVLQYNFGFQVNCEKPGLSSDIISIVWLRGTDLGTTSEMVENSILGIEEEMSNYNAIVNSGNMYSIYFKGVRASVVDYNLILFGEKTYGRSFSFIMNGNTVLIAKQSDSIEKLDTEFKTIENSFNIIIP